MLLMKSLVLFEDDKCSDFYPLTLWRSIFELRVGRKLQIDRLAQHLAMPVAGVWTRDDISSVASQRCGAPANRPAAAETILVNGRWLTSGPVEIPNEPCLGMLDGEVAYIVCDESLANRFNPQTLQQADQWPEAIKGVAQMAAPGRLVRYPWEVIADLPDLICQDWSDDDAELESEVSSNSLIGDKLKIRVGERTAVHPTAIIDATNGPIFISHDVTIGAYAVIEGPSYIGPGSIVNAHTWLHGANAIGPVCKVGGEIDGCVFQGYSNKQHTGFLGHSFVGNWVNIGAGACNSDLKNTYGNVSVSINGQARDTGQMFFGAVIGDHAKIGINASIPTGAIIGMAAVVATTSILPKWVDSFAWLTEASATNGDPNRLLDVATKVMARRDIDMTDEEIELFLELGEKFTNEAN